ncbi:ESX-1 secretion-associated protein [Actinoplanes sp. NBC_00393]|uniref:type VII secretion target n=1 Tax=Actinoplanes sp. NBC_00393 TaxID=2975953 RepID=UPI002E1AF937
MTQPGQGLDIYPPGLRAAADELRTAAEALDHAWQQHFADSSGRGDIFGTDPIGSLIGASYQAALDTAESAYTSVSASFTAFADALRIVADDFENTDRDSAESITRAGGGGQE